MVRINDRPDEFLMEWVLRQPDEAADSVMVDMVADEMRKKLAIKRRQGRRGWFKPDCSNRELWRMLRDHVAKGDPVDVINLAGMILARQKLYGDTA